MKIPHVRSVKIYAVVESVVESPKTTTELDLFLKNNRFGGTTTTGYHEGGIRTSVVKQIIPLTEKEIDEILAKRQA